MHSHAKQIAQEKILEDYFDVTGAATEMPTEREKVEKILEEPDYVDVTGAATEMPTEREKVEKILEEPDYVDVTWRSYSNLRSETAVDSASQLRDQQINEVNVSVLNENRWDPESNYIFKRMLGKGSFSTVFLSEDIRYKRLCAIKTWLKREILEGNKIADLMKEKNTLFFLKQKAKQTAPFFLEIHGSFLDSEKLIFVLSYAPNGTLHSHLIKVGRLSFNLTRFYAAEILLAMEHMHSLGIVHRNLKTVNILLDERMHIKITSFEASSSVFSENKRINVQFKKRKTRSSGVFYVPPEVLAAENSKCSRAADLWGFGAIIYEMISGVTPFTCKSDGLIIKNTLRLRYYFPVLFPPIAKDLVQKLLVLPSWKRLGALDYKAYTSLRSHPFFKDVEFETLYLQNPEEVEEVDTDHHAVTYCCQSRVTGYTGYDDEQMRRMRRMRSQRDLTIPLLPSAPSPRFRLGISSLNNDNIRLRLVDQRRVPGPWHSTCNGNLILLQGMPAMGSSVCGLRLCFGHRRMLILTLGPHLFYADFEGVRLEGEIPWAPDLWVEYKKSAIFVVHTLRKTYYFRFSSKKLALMWCSAIEEMKVHLYGSQTADFTLS